jgi:hypothetical protein
MSSVFREIIEGWTNLIFENPIVEEIAKKRIAICAGDDDNDIKKCAFFTGFKTCEKCGCYMPAKVRSLQSDCPEKYWK